MGSTNIPQRPGATSEELKSIISSSSNRIICVGDIHLADKAPSTSVETYTEDILDMLRYIAKLEKAIKADAVVWAGDVFHHKQPTRNSHALVQRVIDVARDYDNLYCVVGNHDLTSDRLDSLEKQPLGTLFKSGAVRELDGWHPTLPLFGVPWQQRWLHEDTPQEAFTEWRQGDIIIGEEDVEDPRNISNSLVVTHAPIYPPTVADNVLFELVDLERLSGAMNNTGYLYYGHIHEPHFHFEAHGVIYGNMGAISRGSLHEYNLNRKIQVALWTPEHGFVPIDIPHKPAEEIFKLQEAEEKKEEKLSLDDFLSEVGSATLDISSTGTIIEHIRTLEIEEPVKNKSIELLEEVQ